MINSTRKISEAQKLFATTYPQLCSEESDFAASLEELGCPGWLSLIKSSLKSFANLDGLDGIAWISVEPTPLGLFIDGEGLSSYQRQIAQFAQRESTTLCPICGTLNTCSGCRLNATGQNLMPPGWRILAPVIAYEIESLGQVPITHISASDGALKIELEGVFMNEGQETCFRLWSDALQNYCIVCGRDGQHARCTTHHFSV